MSDTPAEAKGKESAPEVVDEAEPTQPKEEAATQADAPPTLPSLPDELILLIAHTYLDPPDILALALTGPYMHRVLLTHPGDIARTRALLGTLRCVEEQWWDAGRIAVGRDGGETVVHRETPMTVATAALLEVYDWRMAPRGPDAAAFAELLLAHPAVDPTANYNSALRLAAYNDHDAVVELLFADSRVDRAAVGAVVLVWAARRGRIDIVQLLLADPRINPAAEDNGAIRKACECGRTGIIKLLLADPRVDPAANNNEAIRVAAARGHTDIVKLLLADPRVDPAAANNDTIRLAAKNDHGDVVELLLADPRVDPAANNNEALRNAAWRGHANVVKLLLADPRVEG